MLIFIKVEIVGIDKNRERKNKIKVKIGGECYMLHT